ncbi:MAG: methyltransferase domain-containing protein [Pseudomonadota bacterium]
MTDAIKSMGLYPRADRILKDLSNLGYGADDPVEVAVLSRFDQLHYHGTDAIDAAISACGIKASDRVLEVGSGWGGCARYLAQATGAHVTAIELQEDYNEIAAGLTARAGLTDRVSHVQADFLEVALPDAGFDHVVSWLALFHIPDRPAYLSRIAGALKPGGHLFAEDLYHLKSPPDDEIASFQAHLFPNSLVGWDTYQLGLENAGFQTVELTDMSEDWTRFTANRLQVFHASRDNYEAIHGPDGYARIEGFYNRMSGYLARGLVGGVQVLATS